MSLNCNVCTLASLVILWVSTQYVEWLKIFIIYERKFAHHVGGEMIRVKSCQYMFLLVWPTAVLCKLGLFHCPWLKNYLFPGTSCFHFTGRALSKIVKHRVYFWCSCFRLWFLLQELSSSLYNVLYMIDSLIRLLSSWFYSIWSIINLYEYIIPTILMYNVVGIRLSYIIIIPKVEDLFIKFIWQRATKCYMNLADQFLFCNTTELFS